jgi:Recombinase zinc beta ribbon domain/Recombinase
VRNLYVTSSIRLTKGWSKHRIARHVNESGVKPWDNRQRNHPRFRQDRLWHSSYIQKLLTNAAVIGTFTPHRAIKLDGGGRQRKPLQPIEKYWPAVVDLDVFTRVSAQAKARAARGRHAAAAPKSVFAGLLRCVRCGGSVVRIPKGDHTYLVCSKAHLRAGCKYLAVRYADAEERLIEMASVLIEEAPRGIDTAEIEAEIAKQANEIWAVDDQVRELADIAATEKSDAARRRLRVREADLENAEEHLRSLRARRDTLASAGVLRRLETVRESLMLKPLNVSSANTALRQAVSKIVMDTESGTLTVHWHHAEQPSEPIYFASRHKRWENESTDEHQ